MRGEHSPHWRGGRSGIRKLLMQSVEYKLWRTTVFERDNYTCRICGVRGGELHADHIVPFYAAPELGLDVDNGRVLCVPCHRQTPTYGCGAKTYQQVATIQ